MKNFHIADIAGIIFVFHVFMSFGLGTSDIRNAFTFPLMHSMITWVRSGAQGESNVDISIGLLMYPTMILNSILWTAIITGMIKLAEYLIWKFRRRKTG